MKGQSALEYFMTYGIALIVIVGIIAALIGLGVFSPQARKVCIGFTTFVYQDQQLTPTQFTLQVVNGPSEINVQNVTVGGVDIGALTLTPPNSISPGQSVTMRGAGDPTAKDSGDTYSETVRVVYDVVGGIASNVDSATCTGKVQ